MITSLFSVFDPCTFNLGNFNWIFLFFFVFFFVFIKYTRKSRVLLSLIKIINFILTDLSSRAVKLKFILVYLLSLFILFCLSNYIGLIPYIFSSTRHGCLVASVGFLFWFRLFFTNIFFNFKNFLAHLVTEGISYSLIPSIVLIESLSILIRPFTLFIRISANIVAGHLLIVLVSTFLSLSYNVRFFFLFLGNLGLRVLERIVIAIQSYVFTILLSLYFSE